MPRTLLLFLAFCFFNSSGYAQKQKSNKAFLRHWPNEVHDSIPSLGSIIVSQHDSLLIESYFNDCSDTTLFSVKSVTKSVTSLLLGIASDQGKIQSLDQPVLSWFPEFAPTSNLPANLWYPDLIQLSDSLRNTLNLRHLLTMQTGWFWNDFDPTFHRTFQAASNPSRFCLELPFETPPGNEFRYCTGASHLTAAILAKAVNTSLDSFAHQTLFQPLGIEHYRWMTDRSGLKAGGSELYLQSRDMLKLGNLVLNQGKFKNKPIVSPSWIDSSTTKQIELPFWDVLPNANGYGFFWWRRLSGAHQVIIASGFGGQLICIVPDLELVVVTTCLVNDSNRGRSELKRLHLLIDKLVTELNH